jgi:poly(A) polymerase
MSPEKPTAIRPQGWMREKSSRAVLAALAGPKDSGARFVGGAVRDAILKRPVTDIDIATPLHPNEVTRRLEAAGIKVVPTGIDHGTVTAITATRAFEITTLRRDVATDGRHAKVDFTEDWAADAKRRDFTMNALFLDGGGTLYDYVGGLKDAKAGRVRFVGDPATRIAEDVLRLPRFYRFIAHYGRVAPDAEARAASRQAAPLLPGLSAERVAAELLKLLKARNPLPALILMQKDGVLKVLLPEAKSLDALRRLIKLEPAPDPIRRLAALIGRDGECVATRLKLSHRQREGLAGLTAPPDFKGSRAAQRALLYRLGSGLYRDSVLIAASRGKLAAHKALLGLAKAWKPVVFPLKGRDLAAAGMAPGPELGKLLAELEAWWIAGDFRASRKACLAEMTRRMDMGK